MVTTIDTVGQRQFDLSLFKFSNISNSKPFPLVSSFSHYLNYHYFKLIFVLQRVLQGSIVVPHMLQTLSFCILFLHFCMHANNYSPTGSPSIFSSFQQTPQIFNNYSPKAKWISVNIPRDVVEGNISPRFTEPEANNCFSLIFRGEYQELKNEELKDGNKKHRQCSLAYV